jgi:hypothetical protein
MFEQREANKTQALTIHREGGPEGANASNGHGGETTSNERSRPPSIC